jgi:hypothetical protein
MRSEGAAEASLRRELRAAPGLAIVTGGQTGVDTYAAHAALRAGCQETVGATERLGRPLLSPDPDSLTAESAAAWLARTGARVVPVAGNGQELHAALARFMAAARRRHDELAAPAGS